jgi:hypothetical protein
MCNVPSQFLNVVCYDVLFIFLTFIKHSLCRMLLQPREMNSKTIF